MMAIWVTAVLDRPNPAVRETPVFEGLLRCRKSVAEREGFPSRHSRFSKNNCKTRIHLKGRRELVTTAVYHLLWPPGCDCQPISRRLRTICVYPRKTRITDRNSGRHHPMENNGDRVVAMPIGQVELLLQLECAGNGQVDVIADQWHVGLHAEITALDRPGCLEANSLGLAHRVDTRTHEVRVQGDWFGDAMQRQITGNGSGAITCRGDRFRCEGRRRKLRGVEPLGAL